jgi:hypothetical protein
MVVGKIGPFWSNRKVGIVKVKLVWATSGEKMKKKTPAF